MKILKKLWTGENESANVKTSYQFVLEQRERLKETMMLAQKKIKNIRSDIKSAVTNEQRT